MYPRTLSPLGRGDKPHQEDQVEIKIRQIISLKKHLRRHPLSQKKSQLEEKLTMGGQVHPKVLARITIIPHQETVSPRFSSQ